VPCGARHDAPLNSGCKPERLFMFGRTIKSWTSLKRKSQQRDQSQSALHDKLVIKPLARNQTFHMRKTEIGFASNRSTERELWQRGDYTISTDRSRLDVNLIHDFISNHSYWGSGRARDVVERSIENSMTFGVYQGEQQVGFARIVTDYATFAWVADVFVVPEHRGRGLSKWLMEVIIAHPKLQGFRRWVLATKDAQGLYEQFGFIKLHRPERWMERPDPNMKESPDYWQQ
jgi:GNAT superfamily N-acetyltransferase